MDVTLQERRYVCTQHLSELCVQDMQFQGLLQLCAELTHVFIDLAMNSFYQPKNMYIYI